MHACSEHTRRMAAAFRRAAYGLADFEAGAPPDTLFSFKAPGGARPCTAPVKQEQEPPVNQDPLVKQEPFC